MTSKTENGDGVLFALAGRIEARLTAAQRQVATLKSSFPPSPGYGGTGLARALRFRFSIQVWQPQAGAIDNDLIQWSGLNTVNFIKQLFSRHPHPKSAPSSSYNWPGQSGKQYPYGIYPFGTVFRPLPGIYIYAKQLADGDWSPIYIAQTRDLHQRLEGHMKLENAIANGATYLHAHYDTVGQSARYTEERDLIQRWHPVCNDVFAS